MADIDLLDNKIEAAKDKLTYAVTIKSQDMIAYNMLGLIYLGDYGLEFQNIENAVMYNRKAYELNRDRITEEVLARSYLVAQDYENAEKHLLNLQSKHPNIAYYSFELGVVKYYLG